MGKLSEKIKEEVVALLPPTIFFFVMLHILAIVRVLMVQGTGLPIATSAQIAVAALILGKAVLIADHLPIVNRFPDQPLVYNVSWKTTIYFLVAMLIHYLERLLDFWREGGGFVAANHKLLAEIVWPHFWAIQIVMVVLIFSYCVMHEFARVIGAQKVRMMFFGPPRGVRA